MPPGTHSSHKIVRATYDSLAFRFIACDQHPDHDTLSNFRRGFSAQFAATFVQVPEVARDYPLSRFATGSLDGTKTHVSAPRHGTLSYGHAEKIEARHKAEVQALLASAEAADRGTVPMRESARFIGSPARRSVSRARRPDRRARLRRSAHVAARRPECVQHGAHLR